MIIAELLIAAIVIAMNKTGELITKGILGLVYITSRIYYRLRRK